MNDKILALAAALLLCASSARAHAHLKRSSPEKDAKLTAAPKEVVAHFSEALELTMCRLTVVDADTGAAVGTGPLANDGKDPASLRVGLIDLPKTGFHRYTVNWKAVATDSHKTQGTFGFTVGTAVKTAP